MSNNWRDDLGKVTHPPAFASLAIDIGPITILVDGTPRKCVGASFRGVSFFVEASELEGGRRNVNHEFPFRAKNFVDDTGKRAQVFKVEGYVIGHGYMDTRDDLIDALNDEDEEGPGTLLHPYHGSILATAGKFSCKEKRDEGGIAHFTIEFLETPQDPPFPSISVSLGSLLGAILGAIAAVIAAAALLALAVILTALTLAAMVKAIEAFVDAIKNACLGLVALFDPQEGAVFERDLELIRINALVLARNPGDLIAAFDNAFAKITGADPAAMTSALLAVATTTNPGPLPTRQTSYFTGVVASIQRYCILRACQYAGTATYDSHQAAVAVRDQISAALDAAADNLNPEVYHQMTQVRSVIAATVPPRDDLSSVVSHTPPATIPSLVLAYQLYGSVSLEDDLIARNRALVPHPGFVRGGRTLEVLAHG